MPQWRAPSSLMLSNPLSHDLVLTAIPLQSGIDFAASSVEALYLLILAVQPTLSPIWHVGLTPLIRPFFGKNVHITRGQRT